MSVHIVLPGALADLAGGSRHLEVDPAAATLAALLDEVAARYPVLDRRIRDEAGALRRFVNVYVDGEDVRWQGGLATAVPNGAVVQVLPSVAGG
ncbi:ubiquitin-like small modifier protein 1 [Blastococcus capsensis]|uniref:ubiquitin-like small modifier protein 1 n=1 Tax=Blastococcus capsensis TaxID=1564163 RepID=UPI00254034A0|nr:ubiquitin-like small modifier protein 1 [Blastococcus capsensis]MDK3258885.1 MoaD/ThiS family protein [Blastococcus capsensis]